MQTYYIKVNGRNVRVNDWNAPDGAVRKQAKIHKTTSKVATLAAGFFIGATFSLSAGLAFWLGSAPMAREVEKCECQCEEQASPAPTDTKEKSTTKITDLPPVEYKDDLEKMICKYDDWDCGIMYAIAKAESGGRCDAVNHNTNGSTDRGVLQVNSIHGFAGDLFDCEYNVKVAHQIWLRQNYQAWTVYNTGAYLKFTK